MTDPNTERQRQTVVALRVAGVALTTIGVVLLISGFVGFAGGMSSDAGFDADFGQASSGPPTAFWLFIAGMPFVALGSLCLRAGFFGAATRFAAREATPALRQLRDDVWPAPAPRTGSFCGSCGAPRGAADRFCPACGTTLSA